MIPRKGLLVIALSACLLAVMLVWFAASTVTPDDHLALSKDAATSSAASIAQLAAASDKGIRQAAKSASVYAPSVSEGHENPDYPTFELRYEEVLARRDNNFIDATALLTAMAQSAAWKADDKVAEALPLSVEERHDGRQFIRFSPLKLESLVPGDEMEIPIAQHNANYTLRVNQVLAHGDGNVTWYGHLQDFPADNQVSITRGQTLTYGGITTPRGLFVLEARDDKGWIVNSERLFKGQDLHKVPPGANGSGKEDGSEHDHSNHPH
jgi:hypothetical protein